MLGLTAVGELRRFVRYPVNQEKCHRYSGRDEHSGRRIDYCLWASRISFVFVFRGENWHDSLISTTFVSRSSFHAHAVACAALGLLSLEMNITKTLITSLGSHIIPTDRQTTSLCQTSQAFHRKGSSLHPVFLPEIHRPALQIHISVIDRYCGRIVSGRAS